MTPIYASDRANIAGWYAYKLPPHARRVFWDGGVGKRDQGATGFWCPYSGTIVDAPDQLIKSMPGVALDGCIDGDEVLVTGFPKVRFMTGVAGREVTEVELDYLYDQPDRVGNFIDELTLGSELLYDTPCRVVNVEKLPDDPKDAIEFFRREYPDGVCRHPHSVWLPLRTVSMMANIKPNLVRTGKVREVFLHEDLEVIDYVTAWVSAEEELNIIPLYEGDDDGDCPFWETKREITLYCVEDLVIGYE